MKKYILIDLDGTLINSKEGITKSLQYALGQMGIIINDLDSLTRHIGPPLRESIGEYYGLSDEDISKTIKKYRKRYNEKALDENEVYEGVEELLSSLKQAGKYLIVATSKQEASAIQVLEHFGLDGYFDDICGANELKDGMIRQV